jgi:hypothetical protein
MMLAMELEAERHREVIANTMRDGHRHPNPVGAGSRWWRRAPGASIEQGLPRRCGEVLATTPALQG